ncbi:glycosyltransferase [Paenibacillus thermotolerans]|uniref:glycosyltransferase n=1 Tax=Paenibacillus thermotolerans TaxID=3027807 RepID=UPI0023675740|nr:MULTISPECIES: glycosyltransferase [unclassified Paenibacillus]
MRIIHAPIEIGGQVGILCNALNRMGHQATGFHRYRTFHDYSANIRTIDKYELIKCFSEIADFYDLYHFHYNMSILPGYGDLDIVSRLNKPMVMHHWGNDVRTRSVAALNNPYVYTGDSPPEEDIHNKLSKVSELISTCIIQDYEVYAYVKPYYKAVHVLPLAIDVTRYCAVYPNESEKQPLIVHAPTNRLFKGTATIESVIEKLRKEFPLRYCRVEKQPHEKAIALYRSADIIVDQILCGSYGVLSVEAMALGKPVIAYIRSDLAGTYPAIPPVCNANPETLYDVLKQLLASGEFRRLKGIEGRRYVEAVHDSGIIGKKLSEIYSRLIG